MCFALGELGARAWHPALLLLAASVLLAALSFVAMRRSSRLALLPVGALWATVGLWCAQSAPQPISQPQLAPFADGLVRQVQGRVLRVRRLQETRPNPDRDADGASWPESGSEVEAPETTGALQVDLDLQAVEEVTPDLSRMVPLSGGVRVTLPADAGRTPRIRCGDRIELPARLRLPERFRDPGAWQYADYLLESGIGAHAGAPRPDQMRVLAAGKSTVRCQLSAAQAWAAERVTRLVRGPANRHLPHLLQLDLSDAAMLNAMLFGDRTSLGHAQRIGFERTGSFHLFVVSGMHLALVAGGLFWIFSRLRLREGFASALTLAGATGYALLTGFGVPVERALAMTTLFLVARLLQRDRNPLNALGAAALAVLVWSPGALFQASFQMTFLAILAITGIAIPLAERSFAPYLRASRQLEETWRDTSLAPRQAQTRVMLRLWGEVAQHAFGRWARPLPALVVRAGLHALELALVGLVAELVMVLPMAVYFHRATVFALPTNLVSVPLVGFLLPLSLATFAGALLSGWLALLPGAATALLLHAIRGVIESTARVRIADLRVPGPVWWVAAGAIVLWGFCCWAVRRRSSRWGWAAVASLPLGACLVLWPEPPAVTPGALELTAIDVGQGDSLLVVAPDGGAMLVDAGGPVGGVDEAAEATSRFDVGEQVVSSYLWSRRLRRLDVVALSHAHSDHMGGMPAILRNFRPRELWVGVDPDSAAYRDLLSEAAELGITVRHLHAGAVLPWKGTDVRVLAPMPAYRNPGAPRNDDSLVMRIGYGRASMLLEGDAEAPSEDAMLHAGEVGPVTLLKVGHHGSRTSSTPAFVTAAAPLAAVVSVGRGNRFGHPRPEVVERFAARGTQLFRTDRFGLTTFLLGRDGGIREVLDASNSP